MTESCFAILKGDQDIFNKIQDKLDNTITNARRLEQFHQTSGTDNPSTMVHSMVEYLRERSSKERLI